MAQPIRILVYSGQIEVVGGDAKSILELISELDPNRYEILFYTDVNRSFPPRKNQWLTRDLPVHYLPTYPTLFQISELDGIPGLPGRLIRYAYRLLTGRWLFGQLKNYRIFKRLFTYVGPIDIFFFNNGGYPGKEAGQLALWVAKCSGVPATVMSLHNMPQPRRILRPMDRVWDGLLSRYCDRVITASRTLKTALHERRHYPLGRTEVIYCGLKDRKRDQNISEAFERKRDWDYLGLVGSILPQKGHAFLLLALREVIRTRANVALVIVGDGPAKELESVRELVSSLGLSDHVQFLGHRSDIGEIMSALKISVVPSVAFEATPYTIKEALREGVPVITTTSGGCAEAIVDGESGLVVEPNDVHGLTRAILRLLEDREYREKIAANGRKRYETEFAMDHSLRLHTNLFEQLTNHEDHE